MKLNALEINQSHKALFSLLFSILKCGFAMRMGRKIVVLGGICFSSNVTFHLLQRLGRSRCDSTTSASSRPQQFPKFPGVTARLFAIPDSPSGENKRGELRHLSIHVMYFDYECTASSPRRLYQPLTRCRLYRITGLSL